MMIKTGAFEGSSIETQEIVVVKGGPSGPPTFDKKGRRSSMMLFTARDRRYVAFSSCTKLSNCASSKAAFVNRNAVFESAMQI